MRALLGLAICAALVGCDKDTTTGGGGGPGRDVGTANEAPDGYNGDLPVGQLVAIELGTGTLEAGTNGVQAEFAPVQSGRKIFANCAPEGCTLELLGRVDAGVAEGSRWEVDLVDSGSEVAAFQKGESRWQVGNDGKDYQVASFYFSDRPEYEAAVGGQGRIELRLARRDEFENEELIGFVGVQVAFEAVDAQ
mgnify:CR=1 FL=1